MEVPRSISIPAFCDGVPASLLLSVMMLSARLSVSVLTVVVVPLTVKSPVTVKALLTVVVPVAAPIERAVAAPAKFTVVAVVLTSANVVLGVVKDVVIAGLVPNTAAPDPVSSVNAVASCEDVNDPRTAAFPTDVTCPVKFALVVTLPAVKPAAVPVTLVITPEAGVPNAGVTNVGLVANTNAPVPVSFVTAANKFALEGVAKNVATPEARPDTPVLIGRPVQLVNVPLDGVPKTGVTKVGLVANTNAPEPVSSVTAASKFAELNEPNTVALPVEVIAPVRLAFVVTLPAVKPAAVPVIFVPTSADGVPKAGVTSVGLVPNTNAPVPVSSVTAANKFALEGVPKKVATPEPKEVIPVPPLATGRVPVT